MRIFFSILFSIVTVSSFAQPSIYFNRITVEKGLSNNQVNCIYQDKRGFIWIGTNDGLNRYDGSHFEIFHSRKGDTASLPGNLVNDILEDEEGILWIATSDGGLGRYDHRLPTKEQFRQYKNLDGVPSSIPENSLNKLLAVNNNFLWIASAGAGVFRLNKRTGRFEKPQQAGPRTVFDIEFDHKGILWAGRQGGGILKINPVTFTSETEKGYEDLYARLPHMVVTALHRDHRNHIWYGSWDKVLYSFDPYSKQETVYSSTHAGRNFQDDEVNAFAEDETYLWIGGKSNGLQIMDKASGYFYQYRNNPAEEGTIASNNISCIYIDRSGRAWIGTNRGISVSDPSQQQFAQTFLSSGGKEPLRIFDFLKDDLGNLWVGTSDGIYLQRKNSAGLIHLPVTYDNTRLAVTKFYIAGDGTFYLGTDYSLFVYDPNAHKVQLLPNTRDDKVMNRIIESRITSIVESNINGRKVLIVTPYGHYISYYDFEAKQWVSRTDSVQRIVKKFNIRDYLVRKLVKFNDGSIWLANTKAGLGKWEPGTGKLIEYYQYTSSSGDGLGSNNVYDILEGSGNLAWISTYGGGLNRLERSSGIVQVITSSNNLLEGIAKDKSGNVWMITNGNLQRYSPVSGATTTFSLPDRGKSGGINGDIYQDREGYMYVAGLNYFIKYDPDSVRGKLRQPQIYFTDFKIFNESHNTLLNEKNIRLGYRQNYFTIEFAAPDFSSMGAIKYSYMLEGWDKDWIMAGDRNYATYTNLEGGTYTFRVKASTTPGSWSVNEQHVKIVIIPPYWKRWWFYVLISLLVAGVIFFIYRYRINELLGRQAIRNKIAQDLHDSVGSTLSSISVYSQVARIYKEKNQEKELQSTLEKISNTSGEMISEMNDIVWTINPRNDSMEKIFQRMESFAKPLLQTREIAFSFYYEPSLLSLNLPMEKRKNFYLIFKEAINNVLKYSECKNLEVRVALENQKIVMHVKDDGKGFDAKHIDRIAASSLTGNGLQNMKRRATEMNGHCEILSEPGRGTVIRLSFGLT